MNRFARLDLAHVWHPFTQMRDWLGREPIVIAEGDGAVLRDTRGREYLDANSSIWTNLHGHRQARLNAALCRQLGRIAHSSALGLANEPASVLAARLVAAAGRGLISETSGVRADGEGAAAHTRELRNPQLTRVFFSDDGSTAVEAALKMAYVFAQRCRGLDRPRFLSLGGAYHGDTVGAVSLGHIDLFHRAFGSLLFRSDTVMAPFCYRCRYNRARPERADARVYRRCRWECVRQVERRLDSRRSRLAPYAAMVVEPLMQGAAGMVPQPHGWLRKVTRLVRDAGAMVIADEVMTGFGRTGTEGCASGEAKDGSPGPGDGELRLFACAREGVQPDFLCLAKGLTGGYLPMAATLTTDAVFGAFLGDYAEFKTFFHGHSYTGNQLGAAAALASLDLLERPSAVRARDRLERALRREVEALWELPQVGDIRQDGLIVGIELVRDWRTREAYDLRERVGIRVCEAMARRGVLTRPIGNVVVLMPPYCTTREQLGRMVRAVREGVRRVLGRGSGVV